MISKIPPQTLYSLLNSDDLGREQLRILLDKLVDETSVIEDSGVPSFKSTKHAWYFNTATNKYYRNVDGGTTWVALN